MSATNDSAERITVEIKRTFTAPRESVFRAWTEKEAMEA
jgi:uncharacterized protein YndB with AHSA1/START domain